MDTATRIEIEALKANEYLGQTGRLPRPSRETHGGKPEPLAAAQKRWDDAEGWSQQNEQLRLARLARLDADRVARREARQQAADERFVGDLKAKYLAADPSATPEAFQADLPEIKRQHRIKAALSGGDDDGAARAATAARYTGL